LEVRGIKERERGTEGRRDGGTEGRREGEGDLGMREEKGRERDDRIERLRTRTRTRTRKGICEIFGAPFFAFFFSFSSFLPLFWSQG
jgi:hypothetical protein